MTLPEACGEAGGAISLWINVIDCPSSSSGGIVSSYQSVGTTGIRTYCSNSNILYEKHVFTNITHQLEKCYKSVDKW